MMETQMAINLNRNGKREQKGQAASEQRIRCISIKHTCTLHTSPDMHATRKLCSAVHLKCNLFHLFVSVAVAKCNETSNEETCPNVIIVPQIYSPNSPIYVCV